MADSKRNFVNTSTESKVDKAKRGLPFLQEPGTPLRDKGSWVPWSPRVITTATTILTIITPEPLTALFIWKISKHLAARCSLSPLGWGWPNRSSPCYRLSGSGGDSENLGSQMLQSRGAHQLPTCGKMSLLGPGLGTNSRRMKRRLAPPSAVCKQDHVELIQHRAHLLQIPDKTVYTPRTCGRHEGVGKGKGNFGESSRN